MSRRGQFLLEYAVLIAAVITAVIAMSRPVQRALNAHTGQIDAEANPVVP